MCVSCSVKNYGKMKAKKASMHYLVLNPTFEPVILTKKQLILTVCLYCLGFEYLIV